MQNINLPMSLEELNLDGFYNLGDGFLHAAFDDILLCRPMLGRPMKKLSLAMSSVTDVGLNFCVSKFGSSLTHLCLKGCKFLSESALEDISTYCPNLETVNIGYVQSVNDSSLAPILTRCRKLRSLVVNDTRVSDATLHTISVCIGHRLNDVSLHMCSAITNAGLFYLAHSCPNLNMVSFSSCCKVDDRGICEIAWYCKRLQRLRLDDTHVTMKSIKDLSNLYHLTHLYLNGCEEVQSDEVAKILSKNPRLKAIQQFR
eukprot:GHVL01036478.1.p1 GENE.GHVL01036478.1~~GHVL01036478.1.p1  ORF type:complete len:258 (-),score=28.32 GHVL01036478.1:127-900(-)